MKGLNAGDVTIKAAVVARSAACGERIVSASFDRILKLTPGTPKIVVQDPYDIEQPKQVMISNNGRYRANIFEGRYKVYDIRSGAKLVDRAGADVNFSPTARFIVAKSGGAGSEGNESFEIIELPSGEPVTYAGGPFIGWAEGDSYLIDARARYGRLIVRPTLLNGPTLKPTIDGFDNPDDVLSFDHPGSCHACTSWADDYFLIDLDNGLLMFTGRDQWTRPAVFELGSGSRVCCETGDDVLARIAPAYGLLRTAVPHAFESRTPLQFSHIYDYEADPANQNLSC